MAIREPWFSRRRTPGDLEARVFKSTGRCKFVDDNGEDMRYKQPGFRWDLFRDIRKTTCNEYSERIQSIFDEVYEKITSIGRERSQSPIQALPTIKTPAISKSRSRLATKVASPVFKDIPDNLPNMMSIPTNNYCENSAKDNESEVASDTRSNPVVVLDITNTSVRRSGRLKRKELKFDGRDEAHFLRENSRPVGIQEQVPHETVLESIVEDAGAPLPPLSPARPKRNTRSRAAKTTASASSTGLVFNEPVRRTTRANTRRAAKTSEMQQEKCLVNENKSTEDNVYNSSGKEEETVQESSSSGEKRRKRKKKSVELEENMSKCRVSLDKIVSPVGVSPNLPTPPMEANAEEKEQSGGEELNEDPATSKEEGKDMSEHVFPKEANNSTIPSSGEKPMETVEGEEEEDPDMAAPPKRSLSVKLKKKGRGKGTRKGAGRGRKGATAATRKATPISIPEEKEDEVGDSGTSKPKEVEKISAPAGPSLSAVASTESLYESCVSQVDSNSPPPTVQTPPTKVQSPPLTTQSPALAKSPSVCVTNVEMGESGTDEEVLTTVAKKPSSRIPLPVTSKSPLPSRQIRGGPVSPLTMATSTSLAPIQKKTMTSSGHQSGDGGMTYVKKKGEKRTLAATHINNTPPLMNWGTPVGPLDATYQVSPMAAPYLTEGHTPKTILKLQEEHRARTKGKLVSLEELRNASPLVKKMTAKKRVATPSTLVKDAPSAGLSPSKIPHLTSSFGRSVKRLRSVSLERLSCQELTRAKRKSKGSNAENCDGVDTVVSDSQDTPRLNHALQGSGCNTSSGSDNDSTPVPASTEEGSSQEEEGDIMNVSTSSSLDDDELPLTPVVQPQEQGTNKEDREGEGEGVCSEGGVSKAGSKSGGKNNKGFILSLFGKKPINLRDADHQLRKPQMAVTSLIPARNSPRKIETRKARQEKLVEKIQRKREEEERRCEELKAKKQQELHEKRKRREEKEKKVAEKQAALKKQEMEKKKRLEGQQSKEDQVKKINEKRAREQEEKQRRLREKMQAAEIKRREEEDAAKRKAQQLEDERRIMTEMASKRKEMEEEEKRQKRQEKQKLERERQLQWKAEIEKEHKRKQRELEEAAERRQQAEKKAPPTNGGKGIKDGSGGPLKKGGDDPKKRLEELLVGAINRVKAPAPVAAVPVTVGESGSSEEETSEVSGSGGQTNKFMQHFFGLVKSSAAKSTSTSTKTVKKTKAPLSTVNSKPPTIQEETSDNNKDISSPSTDDAQSAAMDATTTNVLNSTFTKDDNTENVPPSSTSDGNTALTVPANPCTPTHNGHYHLIPGSSLATTLVSKTAGAGTTAGGGGGDGDGCPMQSQGAVGGLPQSYAMTPAESDPLFAYDNYDIGNLSSDDSTDDEDCPKKVIPQWANSQILASYMLDQEAAIAANCIDVNKIFPPEQLLKDIDLARIFKFKRKRFFQRSSSAHWNSPLYKKHRLE